MIRIKLKCNTCGKIMGTCPIPESWYDGEYKGENFCIKEVNYRGVIEPVLCLECEKKKNENIVYK